MFQRTFPMTCQCMVDASVGEMHIDGEMLLPLAVDTGLEWQGMEHARFAAAETPSGCVEIRYSRLHSGGLSRP